MRVIAIGFLLLATLAGPSATAQQAEAPQLETAPLTIETAAGNLYRFTVELALTPEQQGRGLMFRESLPPNGGMLFVLPRERPASFWMKNTPLSLDIIFIRADGTIANIHRATTPFSEESLPSQGPIKSVLEVRGGTTAQLAIKPGDRVGYEID